MSGVVRVDPSAPGIRRKGAGTGFFYVSANGTTIADEAVLGRIRALAIPPAWTDVWISPEERGHIQATGVDAAGRRQYLYHVDWAAARGAEKFDRAVLLSRRLPAARRRVTLDLRRPELNAERASAAAFRLLDTAGLRIGSRRYARENKTFGISTLLLRHVRVTGTVLELAFTAKGGKQRTVAIDDHDLVLAVGPMLSRRRTEPFLAFPADPAGATARDWQRLSRSMVNTYIAEVTGGEFSAKDIRTWRATAVAARALPWARAKGKGSEVKQTMLRSAIETTADFLSDTPAVARESYVDPRLVAAFLNGDCERTPQSERAIREIIARSSV